MAPSELAAPIMRQLTSGLVTGMLLLAALWIASCQAERTAPEGEAHEFTVAEAGAATPTVALDPREDVAHVVWAQREGEQTVIYHRSLAAGSDTLSRPVRVSTEPSAATHNQAPPQVAVGPDGTLYVAYLTQSDVAGHRFPASSIRLARSTDGGRSFEPAGAPHEELSLPTSHHFFDLAVAPGGNVYVAWLDSRTRDAARRETDNASNAESHPTSMPQETSELPGTEIRLACSEDQGRSFSPSVLIASNTCECCRANVAFQGSDTVYVAWRHIFESQIRDMALARSTDGGQTFGAAERLHPDNWQIEGCPHAGPQLALTSGGRLRAAWYTGKEGGNGLYVAEGTSASDLLEARPLTTEQPVSLVSMSASTAGGHWIAWEEPQERTVRLGRWPLGQDRPAETTVFSAAGRFPWVDATDRQVALTWQNGDSAFLRLEDRTPLDP